MDVLVLPVLGPVLSSSDLLQPKCLQFSFRPSLATVGYLNLPVLLLIFCKVGYFVVEVVLFIVVVMPFFPSSECFWEMYCTTSMVCLQYKT